VSGAFFVEKYLSGTRCLHFTAFAGGVVRVRVGKLKRGNLLEKKSKFSERFPLTFLPIAYTVYIVICTV
jgi:hypothetical protein